MIGLIVPNEPKKIRKLLPELVECPMGYDIQLLTEAGKIGIERKTPSDLLGSVTDGRLNREILAMREETAIQIVLIHGKFRYRADNTFYTGPKRYKGREWTRKGVRNLRRTIRYVEGCYIEEANNNGDLVTILNEIQDYFDERRHLSLKGRPGIHTDWIVPTREEKIRHFYDGLPGIAPARANELVKYFPSPMDLYQASVKDISGIRGFGKGTAQSIYDFLRGT